MSEEANNDQPAVVKTKNPKRVAAGKKLAETNKKHKEYFEKHSGAAKAPANKPSDEPSSNSTNIIVAVGIALVGAFIYFNQKLKPVEVEIVQVEQPKPATVQAQPKQNRLITL